MIAIGNRVVVVQFLQVRAFARRLLLGHSATSVGAGAATFKLLWIVGPLLIVLLALACGEGNRPTGGAPSGTVTPIVPSSGVAPAQAATSGVVRDSTSKESELVSEVATTPTQPSGARTPKGLEQAELYVRQGEELVRDERWEEAITRFSQAIELNPDHAKAYYSRGRSYLETRQSEAAIADFTSALSLDPTYADAYRDRGRFYFGRGRYDEAVADYTHLLELASRDAEAYYERGRSHHRLGEFSAAVDDYVRAVDIDPSYADAYFERARSLRRLGEFERANVDANQGDLVLVILVETLQLRHFSPAGGT